MQGGTTFHFVTGGIHEALALAKAAAGGRDVRVGGGVATVREYLKAGLIDELHLAVRPVLLGKGEALFAGLDLPALGYSCERQVAGERATHMFLRRGAR
jgi:dihydrofolate reductase